MVTLGVIAVAVGLHLIGTGIVREAQTKVDMDLNMAREIYHQQLNNIEKVVRFTALRRFGVAEAIKQKDNQILFTSLLKSRNESGLDILSVTDKDGRVIARACNPDTRGDILDQDEIINRVLESHESLASTEIISRRVLAREAPTLVPQANIKFVATPKAVPKKATEETSGMMLKAAAPVLDDNGKLLGVIYGGTLLNRNFRIVDTIKDTAYQGMTYKGRDIGTATIFQDDFRISTNVKNKDGSRAIGTRVSAEVNQQVLKHGLTWKDRAFVVNDWYLTAYEPIRNIRNEVIGILYVGILEEKYADMKKQTVLVFLSITVLGMILALIFSYFLAGSLTRPIRELVLASESLAQGDFDQQVNLRSGDEIGDLGKTFNFMAAAIKERDHQIKQRAQEVVSESERLAMIGRLAAGVAHEINNPLGGILLFSHLLLEDKGIQGISRENIERVVNETTRCKRIVKGLLDFARQTRPEKKQANINKVLQATLSLLEKQALFQNIKINKDLDSNLPLLKIDTSQIEQVFMNIIMNAAEAMKGQGALSISTHSANEIIEIKFMDTGCGIKPEDMKRLFEPFFTTKETGHGTGLGLAISYGIIEKHNGRIDVKSQAGKGTAFTIKLPVEEKQV